MEGRSEETKFLIVGLGSMGKRRVRNLQYLKAGEIVGFDPREDRRQQVAQAYGIRTLADIEAAMRENPDVLVISTPPDLHVKYAMLAAKNNRHFFMEASVVDKGMDELIALCKGKKIIAAPSCTARFHPSVVKIKELVDTDTIGKVLAFSYHSGQYLPDWHPWEDYRQFYAAKRETGAAREIVPFELVWLTWVFGYPDAISCFKGKLSKLDIDIDDVYQLIMRFKSGTLGHMLVDVVARVPYRTCRLIGEEGLVQWEWGEGVKVYTAKDKKWHEYRVEEGTTVEGYSDKIKEGHYIEEMGRFIRAIKGEKKYPYTLEDDREILSLLYAAERSSDSGKHVTTT